MSCFWQVLVGHFSHVAIANCNVFQSHPISKFALKPRLVYLVVEMEMEMVLNALCYSCDRICHQYIVGHVKLILDRRLLGSHFSVYRRSKLQYQNLPYTFPSPSPSPSPVSRSAAMVNSGRVYIVLTDKSPKGTKGTKVMLPTNVLSSESSTEFREV